MTRLECARLAKHPWLMHAFSTRRAGVSKAPAAGLHLGRIDADSASNVEKNWRLFLRALDADVLPLATLRQIHSAEIYQVVCEGRGKPQYLPSGFRPPATATQDPPSGDALITESEGVLLSVRSADCLPILLVDPAHRAVGAVHAGWRGALERIVEKTVGTMRRVFGSDPQRMLAAIGPSIRQCCYEVGEEVVEKFSARFVHGERFFSDLPSSDPSHTLAARYPALFLSRQPPGHASLAPVHTSHLDLPAVAREQLLAAGLEPSKIETAEFCTACRTDLFFSHRKEGGQTGRQMAVIGIRAQ